ncbi:MAG TPA: hypothetical protein ENK57_08785 [Polyangiaceae bacterium]|nr:hypothetical protein [Polyangiaceae bacterium]
MTELAWDDTDVTMVKPKSATVGPPDLPTLPPPAHPGMGTTVTEVRKAPSAPTLTKPPVPVPLNDAKIGILPPRRFVSQLAITEVEGDERDTWTFIKATMAIPMVKATQALPLVRMRRRRLIKVLPWLAMFCGAVSGVVLCWWLTLPKAPAVAAALAAPQSAISGSVAGVFVDGPTGVRVEIDGVERGVLPLRLEGLSPGEHHFRFDGRPDRGVLERDVVLEGGAVSELESVAL